MRKKEKSGAPGEIRTPGLLVRSQTLYPAELRARFCLTNSSMRYLKREAAASFSVPQQYGELGKETSRGFWFGRGGCVCGIFYFFHCSRRQRDPDELSIQQMLCVFQARIEVKD